MAADGPSSEGLAREAAASRPEAFDALVRRLRNRLEVWISIRMGPLLRSRIGPEDVLQETLLQAHRSIASFEDRGPGSLQRWLFGLAENRIRDLHKFHAASKRHPGREAPGADLAAARAGGDTPSGDASRRETVARVADAISRLEEPLREVLLLRSIEERPFAEVAAALGRPVTTVQGLFARALARLEEELGPKGR